MILRITTKDPAKHKEVMCGIVDGDTYRRTVKNIHYMVKERGYGIQMDVLPQLLKAGVKKVVITTQSGTVQTSNFSDWATHGKKKDYGNGMQIFLDTKYMTIQKR